MKSFPSGLLSGQLLSFSELTQGSQFNLTITARDLGSPAQSSSRKITINVTAAPPPTTKPPVDPVSVPAFNKSNVEITIFDNVVIGQEIGVFPAGDEPFTYSAIGEHFFRKRNFSI